MTPLHRTLARHRIVLRELEADPKHCRETAQHYREEIEAINVAIGVEQLTAQADGGA